MTGICEGFLASGVVRAGLGSAVLGRDRIGASLERRLLPSAGAKRPPVRPHAASGQPVRLLGGE
jgi:hypothetical protein